MVRRMVAKDGDGDDDGDDYGNLNKRNQSPGRTVDNNPIPSLHCKAKHPFPNTTREAALPL